MTEGFEPAMPTVVQYDGGIKHDHQVGEALYQTYGLTKREHFAALFTAAQIQGTVSASGNTAHGWSDEDFAKVGVSIADALINALNQPLK